LNSNKLDFETKRQSLNNNQDDNRESYKPIAEESGFDHGENYSIIVDSLK
jgi:hypothetical protein